MNRIAIVTTTRAEYGLLHPLINRVAGEDGLELDLIVSGTHLSNKYGYTIEEIISDGFHIDHEIPILDENNEVYGISATISNAIKGFAECFRNDRPDMIIILGDRTEMLGVAIAAMNERIPIAHLNGGEVTAGAVDDCVRHALTKMSYLHFVATDVYRRRVIQLGEHPDRVYNVGGLCAENILTQGFMSEEEIRADIAIPSCSPYVITTFHPVTLEEDTVELQVNNLIHAMDQRNSLYYVITGSNADTGGEKANRIFQEYAEGRSNVVFVSSLGMKRYLSAVKYAAFVLGNSSSGMSEAPIIGTPTVNIGDRQKGRVVSDTIICCKPKDYDIIEAIDQALVTDHIPTNQYGDGRTSEKVLNIIKSALNSEVELKKGFYDVKFEISRVEL